MCHQAVRQNPSDQSPASGHAAAGPARGEAGPDRPEDEADGNRDGDVPGRTQSESAAAGDPVEEPAPADGLGCGDDGGGGGKAEPPEEANDGVHGLCFSSTGDFVGFSGPGPVPGPVPGRPSGDFIHEAAPRPSCSGAAFEGPPHDVGARSEAAGCPDGDGGHERTNGLSSTHPSGGENGETSAITSPVESPGLFIRVDDSQSRVENGAFSHSRRQPPACPR